MLFLASISFMQKNYTFEVAAKVDGKNEWKTLRLIDRWSVIYEMQLDTPYRVKITQGDSRLVLLTLIRIYSSYISLEPDIETEIASSTRATAPDLSRAFSASKIFFALL